MATRTVAMDGPAGAFEQRITVLNNSLYNRCLYHQNGPLGCKCGKKRSLRDQEFFEERRGYFSHKYGLKSRMLGFSLKIRVPMIIP
jgi:hypothetical protein